MRYISIRDARPGMLLANDIYDSVGRTLVGRGCELTEEYIDKLSERGFSGVYIDDVISQDIVVEEVIPEDMRQEGMRCVAEGDIDGCMEVARRIVNEILERGSISFDMTDLRSYDNYTYAHSVNVAVLCCAIGVGMNLGQEELMNLVVAALLHDLGKLAIPPEILNKPGRLTKEEFEVMKTHAELSYQLLGERWDVSAYIKSAVLFHHENVDGTGYPQGLTGDEIPFYAKILHVADVYDALVSKRPYKNPYSPSEAAEYLMGACGIMFELSVVECLLKYIPLYPKGSEVQLSDGRKAVVAENKGNHNLRPIVITMDSEVIDLVQAENYKITIVSVGEEHQQPDEADEKARHESTKKLVKKRLMVVDDMKTNLQMLRSFLEPEYDLILLKSGMQALKYLEKNEYPELILMDIDMPDMNGIETTKRIQEMTNEEIPVLFVTALCDRETVLTCRRMHAAGYIVRPYKPVFVKEEINRILTGWSVV